MRAKTKEEIRKIAESEAKATLDRFGIVTNWFMMGYCNNFEILQEKVKKLEALIGKNTDDYEWRKDKKLVKVKEQS